MANDNKVNPDRIDTNRNDSNRDSNPDPITGAPGSHPVATGVGAAAAGAAGAAIGSIVPGVGTAIGAVVGAVVGSVGGGLAGKAAGEAIDPTGTDDYWRENHKTRAYAQGSNYDQLRPAYQYGASLADQGDTATFDESRIRSDWESQGSNSELPFDRARPAIRDEFDRKVQLREAALRASQAQASDGE